VALTTYRDKFEKKIASQYDPAQLHFGRALLTPLIYIGFTLMMILEQSLASFTLASIYQLGYFWFYYDDALMLSGHQPTSVVVLEKGGRTNTQAPA
jgi:hypothetical protein